MGRTNVAAATAPRAKKRTTPAPPPSVHRSSPAERYIKHLVIRPADDADVRDELARLQLDDGDTGYIPALRIAMALPKTFQPLNPKHGPSQDFLRHHGLHELVHRDADTVAAFEILGHPRQREIVETLVLAGGPPPAISQVLHRLGWVIPPSAIVKFVLFFWDIGRMSSVDLSLLVRDRGRRAVEAALAEGPAAAEVVMRAHRRDPRLAVLAQPRSPLSFRLALLRLGLRPGDVDLKETLETVRATAMLRAAEATHLDGESAARRALALIGIVRTASELISEATDPNAVLRDQLAEFRLATDPTPLRLIGELTGGEHSTEMERHEGEGDLASKVEG